MNSREITTYLEQLRFARGMSQLNFIEGIVSMRQYRRYMSGESDIPFPIVSELAERLGIKTELLLREFEIAKTAESKKISMLYNYAVNYNQKEFEKLVLEFPFEHIIESENKIIYQYSVIINNYYSKKTTKIDTFNSLSELIDYPKVLNQLILTSCEILILENLLEFLDSEFHEPILDRLHNALKKPNTIISGGNNRLIPVVLMSLSKYYGIRGHYNKVIDYCKLGINQVKSDRSYYMLNYFYYYSALAYYQLGDLANFEDSLISCYFALQTDNNISTTKKFTELINADFKIDFNSFVIEKITKKA